MSFCRAYLVLTTLVIAMNFVLATPGLELKASRSITDPGEFDLFDLEHGDLRSIDHCRLPGGTEVTVKRDLSASADVVTIRQQESERVLSISDSAHWGTTLVAMDCDRHKSRWFYGNAVKGTVTAYSATGTVPWEYQLDPYHRIPNKRLSSSRDGIGKNAIIALQVRGLHILVEWIDFNVGQRFTVLTTEGKLVDSFGPTTFLLRTGATSEHWELLWGTSPLMISFIPLELYTLRVSQEPSSADSPAAVVARLNSKLNPDKRIAVKVRASALMDHVAALLWSPTTKHELDFCPVVPRESARIWLGSDYDAAVAAQAKRFLLLLWQTLQEKHGEDPVGPLNALFQQRAEADPELARLLAAMAPTSPAWDAAFRPKAIAILESLPETLELISSSAATSSSQP